MASWPERGASEGGGPMCEASAEGPSAAQTSGPSGAMRNGPIRQMVLIRKVTALRTGVKHTPRGAKQNLLMPAQTRTRRCDACADAFLRQPSSLSRCARTCRARSASPSNRTREIACVRSTTSYRTRGFDGRCACGCRLPLLMFNMKRRADAPARCPATAPR